VESAGLFMLRGRDRPQTCVPGVSSGHALCVSARWQCPLEILKGGGH
jgi:hypothetical protein